MAYWLLKTDPEEYSWEKLAVETKVQWTGVRNFEARNHLREMQIGDFLFIYHSGQERLVMGLAKVIAAAYPDPTATKGDWVAIDLAPITSLIRPVSLEEIRNTHGLNTMPLVTRARLSVHPVTDAQAVMLLKIAKTDVVC